MRGLQSDHRAARRARRPRRVHLLRHLEAAGRRRDAASRKVFAALATDKIDEIKVKSAVRRRRRR